MVASLLDTTNQTVVVGGSTTATITLPTAGPRDLTIVAIAYPIGVDLVRRPPPPGGARTPLAAPGWMTVSDERPLAVLATYGPSTLEVTARAEVDASPTVLEVAAASFTGVTEHRDGRAVTSTSFDGTPVQTVPITLAYDGIAISVVGCSESMIGLTGPPAGGWSSAGDSPFQYASIAYQVLPPGAVPVPTWEWDEFYGSLWSTTTLGAGDDATPELVTLPSCSTPGTLLGLAPALGDPPAVFTELTYRSDGIPPPPRPVVTPTDPWVPA